MKKINVNDGKIVAVNRRAHYNFHIEDTFEAGLVLLGSEVKSLRMGQGNIREAYASEQGGELWLRNSHIAEYISANLFNHQPTRPRKLLLKKKELNKLLGKIRRERITVIPLKLYFNSRGVAKIEIGLARGKKLYDKRQDIKSRDWQRSQARIIRSKNY